MNFNRSRKRVVAATFATCPSRLFARIDLIEFCRIRRERLTARRIGGQLWSFLGNEKPPYRQLSANETKHGKRPLLG